ncbi:hypothetical protein OBV_00110 [Oscillibacter valericigenes Sjm18-20]|nr:hypothetical protein OBV_00110 [Oscillibacter valericigenes Sjm18-20]
MQKIKVFSEKDLLFVRRTVKISFCTVIFQNLIYFQFAKGGVWFAEYQVCQKARTDR